MNKTVVDSYSIISALGKGADVTFEQLLNGVSGVKEHYNSSIDVNPVWVSMITDNLLDIEDLKGFSRYEKLLIASINDAYKNSKINLSDETTLFVFSTTKGSIELLDSEPATPELIERINLFHSAELVAKHFGNSNQPVVISNACISGVVALLYAKRVLESDQYKNVVVAGADTISRFVYSGFQSFQALSPGPCHPFSQSRDGINLGEAGATIILTSESSKAGTNRISIEQGSISNDSNHISGPSRTGAELSAVIDIAIKDSGLTAKDIDFISSHGTATPFNDEMEAKAFHLSGLQSTPVNSLKGYFGHTLGAAGLVESVICIMSLLNNVTVASMGYEGPCVAPALNVIEKSIYKNMNHCLKTASGFGGCNAAIIFSKN